MTARSIFDMKDRPADESCRCTRHLVTRCLVIWNDLVAADEQEVKYQKKGVKFLRMLLRTYMASGKSSVINISSEI